MMPGRVFLIAALATCLLLPVAGCTQEPAQPELLGQGVPRLPWEPVPDDPRRHPAQISLKTEHPVAEPRWPPGRKGLHSRQPGLR